PPLPPPPSATGAPPTTGASTLGALASWLAAQKQMDGLMDLVNRMLRRPTRWEAYQQWAADQERQGFIPEVPVRRYQSDEGAASLQDIAKSRAFADRIDAARRTMPAVKEDRR